MPSPPAPPPAADPPAVAPDRAAVFGRERRQLLAVAFRILGSDADAQDVVQEAWLRYAGADLGGVRNVAAWLTTVVTRLCLDVLRRARESPCAPAELPETGRPGPGGHPEEAALLAGELTAAFVLLLDELTPQQRVALVLHDVFGSPFAEVGHVLGTSAGSAKKLASRARERLRRPQPVRPPGAGAARAVVEAFLRAARSGDVDGLVAVLDPDVIRTADPQALAPGTALRVQGVRQVVAETRALRARAGRARVVSIDGRPGIAVASAAGLHSALLIAVVGGRITHYDVVADPRRLALLHIED
jgi:RNA polymerase sigma factor (sigma-70 family)